MQGHALMQAIARVNRVFRDKPGGLVVDFIGLATRLKEALQDYRENDGQGDIKTDQVKNTVSERRASGQMEHAIRQLVSNAVTSDETIDLFAGKGLARQDISILSEEFLADLRGMPQRNLAAEMLQKLLDDEVRATERKNVVKARSFRKLLDEAIKRYRSRALTAEQVIAELIDLARTMKAARGRGEELGLSTDEVAFYDALEVNDSAVQVLGDENLRTIARELLESVRKNISIDWAVKETVRAKLRVIIKRILRKHGYPPDKQESATRTVLEQAELLSEHWTTPE
jgi:type I restriction enzyme R subunit